MRESLSVFLLSLVVFMLAVGCGGGGGDGGGGAPPPPNYSGTWLFQGNLYVNDCNVDITNTLTSQPIVSHNGNDVVVVSNKITLTGKTNADDGFDVTSTAPYYITNECACYYAYVFKHASDGNADAGMGMSCGCSGSTQLCTVGYGGTAVRQSFSTGITIEAASETALDSIANKFVIKMLEKNSASSTNNVPIESDVLKTTAIGAANSAIIEKSKDESNK